MYAFTDFLNSEFTTILLQVLSALGTETIRPSSAAQCVAYIAVAELPRGEWPNLITLLTQNVTNPASTEMTKEATLESIGYICQDIVSLFQALCLLVI